jgi:hypothetical protein
MMKPRVVTLMSQWTLYEDIVHDESVPGRIPLSHSCAQFGACVNSLTVCLQRLRWALALEQNLFFIVLLYHFPSTCMFSK